LVLLMPLAAWSVHQLRYFLTYGTGAARELSDQGHSYLTFLMPAIAGLAALAFGGFLVRLMRAWRHGQVEESREYGTYRLWAVAAAGLLSIYVGQELLEGMLATGHAPGLAGVFGQGGWWAVPAALAVGALVALGLRGARVMESLLARSRSRARGRTPVPSPRIPVSAVLLLPAPLARRGAGRAPPSAIRSV
jgi:hypothetical protein